MRIAVDAMGGDHAPEEIIKGAVEAAAKLDVNIVLVGDTQVMENVLSQLGAKSDKIYLHHASQVVEMKEHAVTALRKKKDSSIMVATGLVKEGSAEALVSCGNTGAQLAAAMFILGRFEGVDRPPIATVIPGYEKNTILLDVGANVDVKPEQLVQFARMGRAYARVGFGIDEPRVGLLNNGEEETKGNQTAVTAYGQMKEMAELNFIGNVEGRDLFAGKADVVVCDGFLGNTILKTLEGAALMFMNRVAGECGPETAKKIMGDYDYTTVGGAPLLGVDGISIVCHGSSKSEAVFNGIKIAKQCVEGNLIEGLKQSIGVEDH
ncbi:MAG: phosphate acyltransferase PlsX [Candidatus Saccharibacteria bacterium]